MWPELLPLAKDVGTVAVLFSIMAMMAADRLITRGSHLRELKSKQEQIDLLKEALTKTEAQRDKLMGLAGDVTKGIVNAIPAARDSVP